MRMCLYAEGFLHPISRCLGFPWDKQTLYKYQSVFFHKLLLQRQTKAVWAAPSVPQKGGRPSDKPFFREHTVNSNPKRTTAPRRGRTEHCSSLPQRSQQPQNGELNTAVPFSFPSLPERFQIPCVAFRSYRNTLLPLHIKKKGKTGSILLCWIELSKNRGSLLENLLPNGYEQGYKRQIAGIFSLGALLMLPAAWCHSCPKQSICSYLNCFASSSLCVFNLTSSRLERKRKLHITNMVMAWKYKNPSSKSWQQQEWKRGKK